MQKRLREMQDAWFIKKADEIQCYADSLDAKCSYDALKAVHGPQSFSVRFSADGTQLLIQKNQMLKRWAEQLNQVLSRHATINYEAIARLPQVEISQDTPAGTIHGVRQLHPKYPTRIRKSRWRGRRYRQTTTASMWEVHI